ncbi:MAG: DUF6293 family protein, partial [Nanoarchaeota archaeon]|nr:DUF6293 family protein [Nanoarchaeota archaeon]
MLEKLRIHIAQVGFEFERVVIPLIKSKADRVYLITQFKKEDSATEYIKLIIKELKKERITDIKMVHCDINDVYTVLTEIKKIIESEKDNLIYINISSGKKISTIAGTMAAMMFKDHNISITPYYVEPERYASKFSKVELMSHGVKAIHEMPTFKINMPKPSLVKVMKFIAKKEEGRRKKEIVDFTYNHIFKETEKVTANRNMRVNRQ